MMSEQAYLDLLRDVMENGVDRDDRTGTGTRSVFGRQIRFDLSKGFPLLTTKKVNFNMVASELLWFIEGSTDERRLAELRFRKPRAELVGKKTIWTDNLTAPYWAPKAKYVGDMGRIYGHQLRRWGVPSVTLVDKIKSLFGYEKTIDQISRLVDGLKNDPTSRRHILVNFNPGELDRMALPACHVMANFYVSDGKLSCLYTMRSNDLFLGSPANHASYALLTHMLAHVCGYEPGELVYSGADCHLYADHIGAVNEQLSRIPKELPTLEIDPNVKNIFDFTMDSFTIVGYNPYPMIKAKMAI